MCAWYYHSHLGKGARSSLPDLHAPVASPRPVAQIRALNPSQSRERIPVQSVARRLRSPLQTIDPFRRTMGLSCPLESTRWTWRRASPPTPNHAQTAARLTTNRWSVPASPDTPMRTSSRPFHGDDVIETNRPPFGCRHVMETPSVGPAFRLLEGACGKLHILCDSGCIAQRKLLDLWQKAGARARERGRNRRSHLQTGRTAIRC